MDEDAGLTAVMASVAAMVIDEDEEMGGESEVGSSQESASSGASGW